MLGGIRSAGFELSQKLVTLVTNSLLETNLGMPYVFALYILYSARYTEDLKKRDAKLKFSERIAEWNSIHRGA